MSAYDDDDEPKKTPKAVVVRRAILVVLALACTGWLVYTRLLVKKVGLGEPCGSNMHCKFEAPKCLKSSADGDGVCSRACINDGECAEGIKCVKVELEEYDERGRPLEGGYCFPQAILDARKKSKDGGAPKAKHDSWVDLPESPGLEGEIVLAWEKGRPSSTPVTYLVKGPLVRLAPHGGNEAKRAIADASALRLYDVDDKKESFSVHAYEAPAGEARITKTETKDKVADRECEVWKIDDGKVQREVCVLVGGAFLDPLGKSAPIWVRELALRSAFPIRIVEKDASGKETGRMSATKVDLRALDEKLFAIPKSFKNHAGR